MPIPIHINQLVPYAFPSSIGATFSENSISSLPLLVANENRIFKAIFLYDFTADSQNTMPRPFAWARFPLDNGPDFLFSWCSTLDFVPTQQFPLLCRVSRQLPMAQLESTELEQYEQELFALSDELIAFAFYPQLNTYQMELVSRYKEVFLLLCPRGLYPFYHALSPEFFSWIGLILVEEPEAGDASPSDYKNIIESLQTLSAQVEQKTALDAQKEALFDDLHQELQAYKIGGYEKLTRAMERDVILVVDHMEKNLDSIDENSPTPAGYQKLLSLFKSIKQDLVDLLYRQGVDPYRVDGSRVDVTRQKVLITEPTKDISLDKTIAERLTQGWEKNGEVVRPEYVRVYVYDRETIKTEEMISSE